MKYHFPRSLLHSRLADFHNSTVSLTEHPYSLLYQKLSDCRYALSITAFCFVTICIDQGRE